MPFDFHKLKTISVANGEVTLRIPERWDVFPHERIEGSWGCYEEEAEGQDTDTGTLWIKVDHVRMQPHGDLPPEASDMMGFAKDISTGGPKGIAEIENSVRPVEQGALWYHVYDVDEDGDMLRIWSSHYFLIRGTHTAIISMDFVLPHYRMDDPEFVELREIMEREIGAAFLDPFKVDEEKVAEDALGPLHRCNFDDRVKLVLPEAMSITIDERAEPKAPRWYCRLSTNTSYAGMFVEWRSIALRDEDGEPVHLPPAVYGDVLNDILQDDGIGSRHVPMYAGVIASREYDDVTEAGAVNSDGLPYDDYHCHVWRNARFAEGEVQIVTVLLLLPFGESSQAPYRDLAGYMNGAVRRAQFPGLPEVERH